MRLEDKIKHVVVVELSDLETIDKLERFDYYFTKEWKSEKAYRFVLQYPDGSEVESSAFIHYGHNDEVRDLTIEVSTMYGCPLKCKFCDTIKINAVKYLTSDEIILQIEKTLFECNLSPNAFLDFRVSFLGIGENSLIPNIIIETSQKLREKYKHVLLNISTVAVDLTAINIWSKSNLPLRLLQVSLPHYDIFEIKKIIPNINSFNTDRLVESLLEFNSINPNVIIVINYLLIDKFNDSLAYVDELLKNFKSLKDVIYFRLSILNETEGTKKFQLNQVSIDNTHKILETIIKNGFNAYIFGSFENQRLSCGQLIGRYCT